MPLFESWKDRLREKIVVASRMIVWETIDSLVGLQKGASDAEKIEFLRRYIAPFNQLDAKGNHFIETVEREDIVDVFHKLVQLSGLQGKEYLADQWREW